MLEKLNGAKYLSKLDLASGYHQVRMADRDIKKTASNTRYGHYKWLVMSFGMTSALAMFQALMNKVFGDMLDRRVLVYLDDILIYSDSRQGHLKQLRKVLQRLQKAQLYAQVTSAVSCRNQLNIWDIKS